MTVGEPETAVSASLQKIKLIKNQHKHLFSFFISLNLSDSFVNHFDGHFAYLKTLDFSFKMHFSLPQLFVFLFDVLSVAVFVIRDIRDRFVKKLTCA